MTQVKAVSQGRHGTSTNYNSVFLYLRYMKCSPQDPRLSQSSREGRNVFNIGNQLGET